MNTAGLVKPRLAKMHDVLSGHIERKQLPGLTALVSCHDDVHVEELGTLAFDSSSPVKRDTIFRIASLTKVVTAAAAMMLIEDCKIRLDDKIERWIPELANRRVLKTLASEIDDTVPAKRAITLRDVLTYRFGFGSVMAGPGTYPIQKHIRELKIGGDGPMLPTYFPAPDEWLRRLGSLPLIAQPGERWMYHVSGDLLGVLIARVSGKSFGEFLRERIFGPLGMKDTGFHVPADKMDHLPGMYHMHREKQRVALYEETAESAWRQPPVFEAGGGGLVSTLDDYFAFSRMLLNKGRHGNDQLLSRASVELMTSDQLSAGNREGSELFFGDFSSWGLGVAVDVRSREIYQVPGRYGWTGGYGTTAYNDPVNGLIGILFTQRMMDSPEPPQAFTDFWNLAYAAME